VIDWVVSAVIDLVGTSAVEIYGVLVSRVCHIQRAEARLHQSTHALMRESRTSGHVLT
jgi:hypothetical protein